MPPTSQPAERVLLLLRIGDLQLDSGRKSTFRNIQAMLPGHGRNWVSIKYQEVHNRQFESKGDEGFASALICKNRIYPDPNRTLNSSL